MAAVVEDAGAAAPAAAAEDPLYANLLAEAPAEKRDAMVSKLRERLAVLDACAAVDLTEPEKKEISGKRRGAAKKKSNAEKEAKKGAAAAAAAAEDRESAVEKLLATQKAEFEARAPASSSAAEGGRPSTHRRSRSGSTRRRRRSRRTSRPSKRTRAPRPRPRTRRRRNGSRPSRRKPLASARASGRPGTLSGAATTGGTVQSARSTGSWWRRPARRIGIRGSPAERGNWGGRRGDARTCASAAGAPRGRPGRAARALAGPGG